MDSHALFKPCFQPGRVLLSNRVADLAIAGRLDVLHFYRRHLCGDWGGVPTLYGAINDISLRDRKDVLMSRFYFDPTLLPLVVVTRFDRGITTLLFPDENALIRSEQTN